MSEFIAVVLMLSAFWLTIWSLVMMSPIVTALILIVWIVAIYLLDRNLRKG